MSDVYRIIKIKFFAKLYLGDKQRPVRKATSNDDYWATTHWRGKRKQAGPRKNGSTAQDKASGLWAAPLFHSMKTLTNTGNGSTFFAKQL